VKTALWITGESEHQRDEGAPEAHSRADQDEVPPRRHHGTGRAGPHVDGEAIRQRRSAKSRGQLTTEDLLSAA